MRVKHGVAALGLSVIIFAISLPAHAQPGAGPKTIGEADETYPKVYVCKNTQYATIIEDKAGTCTPDHTPLIPIRMGLAFKCLRGPADIQATEGPCAVDHQPKGPVTVSVFWTCKSAPASRYLDPGKCSDNTPREIGFEERPHGDHNTRHGGDGIIMSADLFHHIEGTLAGPGLFRVYFYNEFTKPMNVAGFTGRVAIENSNFTVTGPEIPLKLSSIKDGNALEATIPNAPVPTTAAPVYVKLFIKLKPGADDWKTDHQFRDYSKDPAPPAAGTSSGTATGANSAAAAKAAAPKATAPKPAALKPAAPKIVTPPPSVQESAPASSAAMSGGAEVGGGATDVTEVSVNTKPELLALLKEKAENVTSLVEDGQLGGVWFPALVAKNAGLALQANHEEGMSEAEREGLASAVKQLTVAAWQIDAAGDLGNAEQIHQLRDQFEAAVSKIQTLYGQGR